MAEELSLRQRLGVAVARMLGVSAYELPTDGTPSLGDRDVERLRELFGGQIQLPPTSQVRWYLDDLEAAEHAANAGQMAGIGRLCDAARKDGVFAGVLSTRCDGLVQLPKRWAGDDEVISTLTVGSDGSSARSIFDEMHPPAELALLAGDGLMCGVGVGELVPVKGRDYPVLVRYDPQYLVYLWNQNRWFFRSAVGMLPITPGDGRWILHVPGGKASPWKHGLWKAIGRAYIRKEHANLYKDAWEAKLANPARVATSPQGASEKHKQAWFRAVMAWGVNTVFGLTPGYDVKLLESNGRGYDSFLKTIADQNNEMIIAVAGQTVTTTGGAGFVNKDIHSTIRGDLIQKTADDLAWTLNTQSLPPYVIKRWGADAFAQRAVRMSWDTTPPEEQTKKASMYAQAAAAIDALRRALLGTGLQPDVRGICREFGIPVEVADAIETEGVDVTDESEKKLTDGTSSTGGAKIVTLEGKKAA